MVTVLVGQGWQFRSLFLFVSLAQRGILMIARQHYLQYMNNTPTALRLALQVLIDNHTFPLLSSREQKRASAGYHANLAFEFIHH